MPGRMDVREARASEIPRILEVQRASYPLLSTVAAWSAVHLESHQRRFPEGQLVAVEGAEVVGHSASFVTTSERAFAPHTFREITARGTFETHDPTGDVLYGAEIMVHPSFRRRGIAKRLYARRFDLVRRLGLRWFVAGGRVPGFEAHRDGMAPAEYVERVVAGRIEDRVLSAQLKVGLRVHAILEDYLSDPRSGNVATLLVWENLGAASRRGKRPGR